MRARTLWPLCGGLVAGIVVLASPASAINTCATICHCAVACSTSCLYAGWEGTWPDREFVIWAESCGEYGLCEGTGTCLGSPAGCPAQRCTTIIYGTNGSDTLNGGSARECIYGFGGNDVLDGNAGDDILYGGDGDDTLYGGTGNDCLYGGPGNDYLDGGPGFNLLVQ